MNLVKYGQLAFMSAGIGISGVLNTSLSGEYIWTAIFIAITFFSYYLGQQRIELQETMDMLEYEEAHGSRQKKKGPKRKDGSY